MQYSDYDSETQTIKIGLDTGGEIELNMEEEYLAYYGPSSDLEIDFIEDDLKDIHFKVSGWFLTGLEIVQWAQINHDKIQKEEARSIGVENAMHQELSSPYQTGRI